MSWPKRGDKITIVLSGGSAGCYFARVTAVNAHTVRCKVPLWGVQSMWIEEEGLTWMRGHVADPKAQNALIVAHALTRS